MRVAAAQLEARSLADAASALADAQRAIADAARAGAELVVLPEGTYPGYVLGSVEAGRRTLAAGPDPLVAFASFARDAGIAVVAGIVLPAPAGPGLLNAAVLFDRTGNVRARAAKRFLWHFDSSWFSPGAATDPADGVGMLVCADGRLPEIAGGLVRRGARLLCDPTAWVTPDALDRSPTNIQSEFMWRVRCFENGVPGVAASKVGVEGVMAAYCGQSQIVAADGTVVALASATEDEVIVGEVELGSDDRRVAAETAAPVTLRGHDAGLDVVHVCVATDVGLEARAENHGAGLIVGPEGVVRCDPGFAVAELAGTDGYSPGRARAAMVAGAAVIVWIVDDGAPLIEAIARTRAAENRVFVVCWRSRANGGPLIVSPTGRVLARMPRTDRPFLVSTECLLAEARVKRMAPGTDIRDGLDAVID